MWKRDKLGAAALVAIVLFVVPAAWADQVMHAAVDANSVSIDAGAVQIAEYRYADVPFKPYIKKLFAPSGLDVLLDAPHDHLHHHGLMFAVAVNGVNFWEEDARAGSQMHVRFADMAQSSKDAGQSVGFMETLNWVDPNGQKLLAEQRSITIHRLKQNEATVLMWDSRLAAPADKPSVTLSGAHYFGLGMRFIRAMDGKGTFHNADNKPGTIFRGQERLVRSNWCAYTAQVDGQDVTAAMFGHPDNPRYPTTWFTMAEPFAYLSATLGLHEKPLEVVAGKPLRLRYAVVLWSRAVESKEIEKLYEQWKKD